MTMLDTTDDLEDVLTGNSHLEPGYRPNWENSNPDWEDGQILLEGELDFPADQPAREVAESLRDRSETIGALVSHDRLNGQITARPWNGPGYFRLNYDSDDPGARVESITVFDGRGRPASHTTLEDLKARGERTAKLAECIQPAGEESSGDVYRITTDGLVPVDDD